RARVFQGERPQVVTGDHSLGQLPEIVAAKQSDQLRLANQDDLQELPGGCFEIREESDLLQHVRRQVLRLVDDEHRATPAAVRVQQILVELVDEDLPAFRSGWEHDAQLVAHRRQEFHVGQLGIQDERYIDLGRELLEQTPAEGGLPSPDLAGELDEAASLADSVQEMCQALAVPAAHIEVARIRRDGKRGFRQTEIRGVG